MSKEIPISLEDVKFFGGREFVVTAVGASSSQCIGVFGCKIQGALSDAEIEVGEDELDSGQQESCKWDGEDGGVGGF